MFDAPATGWPYQLVAVVVTTSASIVSSSVATNARGEPAKAGASSSAMPWLRRTLRPPDSIPSRSWRICSNGRVPNLNRHRGFGRNAAPVQRVANRGQLHHIGNVLVGRHLEQFCGPSGRQLLRCAGALCVSPAERNRGDSDTLCRKRLPSVHTGRVPRLGTETCVSKDICFGMTD
jgi:hypothetical protein